MVKGRSLYSNHVLIYQVSVGDSTEPCYFPNRKSI